MDHAVALVQAWLHLNGYLTVTEYPVLEEDGVGGVRALTDVDLVALRLAGAGGLAPVRPGRPGAHGFQPGPVLGGHAEAAELLIIEVKEGRADLNRGAQDPRVLRSVLARFGCCPTEALDGTVASLRRRGEALLPSGLRVRLVAFGSLVGGTGRIRYLQVALGHVVQALESHLTRHWELLRHAQARNPAFGLMLTMEKARRGLPASAPPHPAAEPAASNGG